MRVISRGHMSGQQVQMCQRSCTYDGQMDLKKAQGQNEIEPIRKVIHDTNGRPVLPLGFSTSEAATPFQPAPRYANAVDPVS